MPLLGCRVLIVEDEYFLADDLGKALDAHGAQVIGPIAYLEEALGQVGRGGFDVAVVDINLHDQAAYVIAERLEQAAIPFVFATGYSAEVIPSRFQHVIRLEKPYNVEDLVRTLSGLCPTADA
jgi:DNA-binding LytR/AlgR family response regulator